MVKRHLKALHDLSRSHRSLVESSAKCGCFYCGKMFPPAAIREWVDKLGSNNTALCPKCGIDSVLPGKIVRVSKEVLDEMNDYYFGEHRSIPAAEVSRAARMREEALKKLSAEERRVLGLYQPDDWEEY
jgi:hypothetical protein